MNVFITKKEKEKINYNSKKKVACSFVLYIQIATLSKLINRE